MKLYIQIENDQPVNHPATEENLLQSLGLVPQDWEPFVRLIPPTLGVYEKNQTVSYHKINGVWTDVFSCEQMTPEEILAKQTASKEAWATSPLSHASWTFDEVTCSFIPPKSYPNDGNNYLWRESDLSWVLVPTLPSGEGWKFNVEMGRWEKV